MDKFVIFDNYLCFRKEGSLKQYFNLKTFDEKTQNKIVETLNDHYSDLTVLKNPSTKNLTFLIKGKPYLEQDWIGENSKTILHPQIEHNNHNILPVIVSEHHYMNIFDNCKTVKANLDEYYIIKCDNNRGIYVVDKNNHIVQHTNHIFENFNVFEGCHIVVDIDTFLAAGYIKDNGLINVEDVKKTILTKYNVSYLKKILSKKDLKKDDLLNFIKESRCKINSSIGYDEHGNYVFFLIDNFGDHYEIKAHFEESNGTSIFTILKKVNH